MEKGQQMILDEFALDLQSSLNLSYLLPHLMKRKLLTASEEHRLKSEAKTDRDSNSQFIDYLKTKGSHAFDLFLEALKDETEHLGHVDLYKRMFQCSKSKRNLKAEASSFDQLPLDTSNSASVENDRRLIRQHHSTREPAIRCETLDSSVKKSSLKAQSTGISDDFTVKSLNAIMQRLDKIEETVMDNQSKLKGLKEVCDKMMSELDKCKVWGEHQYGAQPDSRGSRPGSSGAEADCSSGGSGISLASIQLQTRQHHKKQKRRSLPAIYSQSSETLHSTHEEVASDHENFSALALPRIIVPNQPYVSLIL